MTLRSSEQVIDTHPLANPEAAIEYVWTFGCALRPLARTDGTMLIRRLCIYATQTIECEGRVCCRGFCCTSRRLGRLRFFNKAAAEDSGTCSVGFDPATTCLGVHAMEVREDAGAGVISGGVFGYPSLVDQTFVYLQISRKRTVIHVQLYTELSW